MTTKTFKQSLIPTAGGDFVYGDWHISFYIQDPGCECCSSSVIYDAYNTEHKVSRYDFTCMFKLLEELDKFDDSPTSD